MCASAPSAPPREPLPSNSAEIHARILYPAVHALMLTALLLGLALQGTDHRVAVTIDDLPAVRVASLADARRMTSRLLDQLAGMNVPAVGFVNEGKLDAVAGEKLDRIALLSAWLDAGHDLGNHTYSHLRFYSATTEAFQADIIRGEQITRPLMAARGKTLRWFRHPTLNTGRTLQARDSMDQWFTRHGYLVAPVTIDNDEFVYAAAYDRARSRADSALMKRLGDDYIRYMDDVFGHYEQLSLALFGRLIPQILLLHANWLNADYMTPLIGMMTGRRYRFISLSEALADSAYRHPDRYIGSRGPSWLERWAVTRGQSPASQPEVPAWVLVATR